MSSRNDPSTRGPSTRRDKGDAPATPESPRGARSDPPPRRKGIAGVPGSKNPERRCTATVRSTGERCKRAAIKGGTVCTSHGGAAPQVRKKARDRLLELVDPAINELAKLLNRDDVDDSVRLRAITSLLDRVGYGPGSTLKVEDTRWDDFLGDITADGMVSLDRSMLDEPDRPAISPGGGDAPLGFEDAEQHAHDAREAAWVEFDHEDAQPYVTKLDPYDGNTVRGEVVDPAPRYDPTREPEVGARRVRRPGRG